MFLPANSTQFSVWLFNGRLVCRSSPHFLSTEGSCTGDGDREVIFSVLRADRLLLQLEHCEQLLCHGDHTDDVGPLPGDVGVLLSGNLPAVLSCTSVAGV